MSFQDHPSQQRQDSQPWISQKLTRHFLILASDASHLTSNIMWKKKNPKSRLRRKCSYRQIKIYINSPVTTLGILVMKLLTVLMGTPSVSCWMLVTMSSICRGRTAERSEKARNKTKKQRSTEERWPLSKLRRSQQRTFSYCWDVHHSTLELRSCFKVVGVREWERVRKRRQLMLTHKNSTQVIFRLRQTPEQRHM